MERHAHIRLDQMSYESDLDKTAHSRLDQKSYESNLDSVRLLLIEKY